MFRHTSSEVTVGIKVATKFEIFKQCVLLSYLSQQFVCYFFLSMLWFIIQGKGSSEMGLILNLMKFISLRDTECVACLSARNVTGRFLFATK